MSRDRQSAKGFTLVEIMTVIAIMGVIAALLVMAARGARQSSDADAAKAGVAFVSSKIEQYIAKRGELPPDLSYVANPLEPAPHVTTEVEIYTTLNQWGYSVPPEKQVDPWGNPYIIVLKRDYNVVFPLTAGTDYASLPFLKMANMYVPSGDQEKDILDTGGFPYNDGANSVQVICAGPDGKVSRLGSDTTNSDNLTNW